MKIQKNLYAPWTLYFDRDGTEDVAILCDADGEELATSRPFWLPEAEDPEPPIRAEMQLMETAPQLLAALERLLDAMGGLPITIVNGSFYQAIDEARAAVTAATGE